MTDEQLRQLHVPLVENVRSMCFNTESNEQLLNGTQICRGLVSHTNEVSNQKPTR
jgi:hypothetical protein